MLNVIADIMANKYKHVILAEGRGWLLRFVCVLFNINFISIKSLDNVSIMDKISQNRPKGGYAPKR